MRIDEVNVEGQAEDAYRAVSIAFHYFETIAGGKLTDTDIAAAS